MSWSDENDGEAALFQREMRNDNLRRMMKNEPYPVEINLQTLRVLVKQHNGALKLLREMVDAHPEDTELMGRIRAFVKKAK